MDGCVFLTGNEVSTPGASHVRFSSCGGNRHIGSFLRGMVVWLCDCSMADGLEEGKSENEAISPEEVEAENLKLLHKGNNDEGGSW